MLPPARFSLVTAQSPCAKTSQSLKNIRDCVPGPAGTGLTDKINIDVFLCFLNCLRAVLAVAEAVNDPWECLPAAPGGQGRLWAELSLIPQKPGIVFQGGKQLGTFSLLCTNLWLEGLDQLSSPSPSSTWGHLPPSPSIWNDYSSYFHPCFLRSHFRAHTIPWGPAGHLGSQGRHHLTALAPAEGPCCGGRRENQFHPKEPWKAAACRGSSVSPASASR